MIFDDEKIRRRYIEKLFDIKAQQEALRQIREEEEGIGSGAFNDGTAHGLTQAARIFEEMFGEVETNFFDSFRQMVSFYKTQEKETGDD